MTAVAMASDEIYDWWLSFITSFRSVNPNTPLIVIPYNDNVARIAELSDVFDYKMLEADFSDIDHLSERLFEGKSYRNRLRKLKAFDLPVDQFIYIDVDTLVYLPVDDFMRKFAETGEDIAFCTPSVDTTFNQSGRSDPRFSSSRHFSTGFLAANRSNVSFDGIMNCIEENIELYKSVRHENVIDQPILNFCASILGWGVLRVDEIDRKIAPHKWYLDDKLEIQDGVPRMKDGRILPVVHWAGNEKIGKADPSIELRRRFIVEAQVKIGQKKHQALRVIAPTYSFEFKGKEISSNSYGNDYLPLFIRSVIRHVKPQGRAFLEWGSGLTSMLLADLCRAYGASRLITMDNYQDYQTAVVNALPTDVNVTAQSLDVTGPCLSQKDTGLNYSMFPLSLGETCDFIFIDGRRRMECLMAALPLCHEDTVIMIHDYRRTRYQLALAYCDLLEDNEQFRVLKVNPGIRAVMQERREAILAAYSG